MLCLWQSFKNYCHKFVASKHLGLKSELMFSRIGHFIDSLIHDTSGGVNQVTAIWLWCHFIRNVGPSYQTVFRCGAWWSRHKTTVYYTCSYYFDWSFNNKWRLLRHVIIIKTLHDDHILLIRFEAQAKLAQQLLVCAPLGIHLEPINK